MKSNAIVRIVLFSIAIVLIAVVLVGVLNIELFSFRGDGESTTFEAGGGKVPVEKVRNLCVEWVSGNITIQKGDTQDIIFEETSDGDHAPEMNWKLKGDTLTIQFEKPDRCIFCFDFKKNTTKSKLPIQNGTQKICY